MPLIHVFTDHAVKQFVKRYARHLSPADAKTLLQAAEVIPTKGKTIHGDPVWHVVIAVEGQSCVVDAVGKQDAEAGAGRVVFATILPPLAMSRDGDNGASARRLLAKLPASAEVPAASPDEVEAWLAGQDGPEEAVCEGTEDDAEFARAWQASATLAEVGSRCSMTPEAAMVRAHRLRQAGVRLKMITQTGQARKKRK